MRWRGRCGDTGEVELLLDPLGAVLHRLEVGVAQDREIGRDRGGHTVDDHFLQRANRASNRSRTILAPHNQLADQVVVVLADCVAALIAGVETHTETVRRDQLADRSGRRQKLSTSRVLRVDAHLDAMALAFRRDFRLRHRQHFTACDANLPLDEIDAGDHLRNRMLDLQSCVHLKKEEFAVLIDELDGARVVVADSLRRFDRGIAHCVFDSCAERVCWRLFDQLLMASLRRAVARADPHQVAVLVANELHFYVTRPGEVALEVDLVATEESFRLALGTVHRLLHFVGAVHDLHASTTTTKRGLDRDWESELGTKREDLVD